MLFWVASYPRSGNGFLRTILRDLCGVLTTSVDQCPHLAEAILGATWSGGARTPANAMPVEGESPRSYGLPPPKPWTLRPLADIIADPAPHSLKTHLLASDQELPAVYLVRDARDVLVSYARFAPVHGEHVTDDQLHRNLRGHILESGGAYGSWSENVETWLARPRTCLMRFEELVQRPIESLRVLIEALALPCRIRNTRVPTFAELQSQYPHVYRRGRIGGWRDEFPTELLPLFWERHGRVMRRLGYVDES